MAKKKVDPKKAKYPPTNTNPKITPGTGGAPAKVVRNKKGDLEAIKGKDFYNTPENQAIVRKNKLKKGDSTFSGAPAPRVGGKQKMIAKSGPVKGGTKKMLSASKKRVNKSAASPQAKRSAKRLY